jgi:uncharacterized membrane protein
MLAGAVFMACASPLAQAATHSFVPDCSATGGGWACYLPGIFQFLWVIAIILGLILLAVIAVAVRSYFRIKHEEKVDS